MRSLLLIIASCIGLGLAQPACRNELPPTEPPRSSAEATPESRTNDAPGVTPLATASPPLALDAPPVAQVGGSGGRPAGGTGGTGSIPPPSPGGMGGMRMGSL